MNEPGLIPVYPQGPGAWRPSPGRAAGRAPASGAAVVGSATRVGSVAAQTRMLAGTRVHSRGPGGSPARYRQARNGPLGSRLGRERLVGTASRGACAPDGPSSLMGARLPRQHTLSWQFQNSACKSALYTEVGQACDLSTEH